LYGPGESVQLTVVADPLFATASELLISVGWGTVVPEQTPAAQTSFVVQALPSLQGVPFGFGGAVPQTPLAGLHVPGS
jgi:hypothetical protein